MKVYSRIRGSMEVVSNIEVNVDTVYVRSNIVSVNDSDFKGWEYDEIQYGKNEYIELITKKVSTNQGAIDFIIMNS
jgi:hypothetical protein